MASLADFLKDWSDKVVNLPTEAQRFMVSPTSFVDALRGKTTLPAQTGFAQGATGVPQKENLTVLDPNNRAYMEGYSQGEPFGYAAMAIPGLEAGATRLSNKAVQAITGNPLATGAKVIDYAGQFSPVKSVTPSRKDLLVENLNETVVQPSHLPSGAKNPLYVPPKPVETVVEDYKMQHQAPGAKDGSPLYDLTSNGIYPEDFYSLKGAEYYGHGADINRDRQVVGLAQRYKNRPMSDITIYRAVPKNVENAKINTGDWVTIDKKYAKEHGEANLNNEYKIIQKKVKAKDIFTNGDSIYEFGYDPQPYDPAKHQSEYVKNLLNKANRKEIIEEQLNKLKD